MTPSGVSIARSSQRSEDCEAMLARGCASAGTSAAGTMNRLGSSARSNTPSAGRICLSGSTSARSRSLDLVTSCCSGGMGASSTRRPASFRNLRVGVMSQLFVSSKLLRSYHGITVELWSNPLRWLQAATTDASRPTRCQPARLAGCEDDRLKSMTNMAYHEVYGPSACMNRSPVPVKNLGTRGTTSFRLTTRAYLRPLHKRVLSTMKQRHCPR